MPQLLPEPVACMRGNLSTGYTYDAEISFGYNGGPHRVLSTGHKSYEEAKAAAVEAIARFQNVIAPIINEHFGHLPIAKP